MREHVHPITIFYNLWRFFYLIIIPVVRGLFSALQGDFAAWLRGAWIDILILLLMVTFAVYRWWRVTYRVDDDGFHLHTGVLARRHTHILWRKVTTLAMVEPVHLRPFHAAIFRLDTLGGRDKDTDLSIYLSPKKAGDILHSHRETASEVGRQYIPRTFSILSLAFLSSNSLVGVIFIATFISQSGRLLGNEFADMLVGTFEELIRQLAFSIPPAAAAIAYVLLAGWLVGFFITFTRYKNFAVTRRRTTLQISGGVLTRREYHIKYSDINYIEIRQSVVSKALRLYALYISAAGYGKHKDDISCVVPTERLRHFPTNQQHLFPDFTLSSPQVRPSRKGFMRFLFQPLIPIVALPLGITLFVLLFPSWSTFIFFVGLMLLVPSVLFLIVRFIEYRTSGFSFEENCYTIRYSKGFNLQTVIFPQEKVVAVKLRQSLPQRFGKSDNCDLLLYTVSERRHQHHCRNLNRREIMEMLGLSHP